ncbi:MAG TPA: hypothetical protein VGM90_32260 [Kofleriaceae bacterium]|jgi:soluble cytochrome b562
MKMSKSTLLVSVLSLAIGAGCQKSTDLTKMQAESLSTIKLHTDEIDTQSHRREDLAHRIEDSAKNGGPSLSAPATLAHAEEKLQELRKIATGAPSALATAARGQYPDEEIIKAHDETVEELVLGLEVVKSDLAATETWYAASGSRVAIAAPPPPTPPTDMPPPPTEGGGSAAPRPPAPVTPPPAHN